MKVFNFFEKNIWLTYTSCTLDRVKLQQMQSIMQINFLFERFIKNIVLELYSVLIHFDVFYVETGQIYILLIQS